MNIQDFDAILELGENVAVEFKRGGNGLEHDSCETVCAFLNRFGGDLFLGVLDDGTVCGVPERSAGDIVKNFISVLGNPALFTPTLYLVPETVKYHDKTIIHIHVPPSAEVHSYKKVIYDRVDGADVKVTATSTIAAMYIRKQNIFTEKKIYPYVVLEDLRLDLLPKLRQMAINNINGKHAWEKLSDAELLRSAGLYGLDRATDDSGYNLAAVMLLGKDDVIQDICPAYETDALVRKENVDRYDDRETIRTNLIESFDQLLAFGQKHLPDKFYLEDTERKSIRNIILREMIANTLIHREFTSSYQAKFIIEKERMFVANANRASSEGFITPVNFEPNPKNPIIASFFRNIGRADRLGSGVRNLFKYCKLYSGSDPEFVEGDVFRIIIPLKFKVGVLLEDQVNTDQVNTDQVNTDQVNTDQVSQTAIFSSRCKDILAFCHQPKSLQEILAHYNITSRVWFKKHYIDALIFQGKLSMTIPDKPNSRLQKYVTLESVNKQEKSC